MFFWPAKSGRSCWCVSQRTTSWRNPISSPDERHMDADERHVRSSHHRASPHGPARILTWRRKQLGSPWKLRKALMKLLPVVVSYKQKWSTDAQQKNLGGTFCILTPPVMLRPTSEFMPGKSTQCVSIKSTPTCDKTPPEHHDIYSDAHLLEWSTKRQFVLESRRQSL